MWPQMEPSQLFHPLHSAPPTSAPAPALVSSGIDHHTATVKEREFLSLPFPSRGHTFR